jgi:hypothetical protein
VPRPRPPLLSPLLPQAQLALMLNPNTRLYHHKPRHAFGITDMKMWPIPYPVLPPSSTFATAQRAHQRHQRQ